MARLLADTSHSTEKLTFSGSVYEVVFQTDEMYFTLVTCASLEHAQAIVDRGNSFLDPKDVAAKIGFEIRERKVAILATPEDWNRQDFIDDLDGWDISDYFLPELDPEEGG